MAGSSREKRPGVWELCIDLGRDASGKVKHIRHYTDAVSDEDRRAADHMGETLGPASSDVPGRRPSLRYRT